MSASPARRFAALSGLAVAAALAVWWLGSTRLAIDRGADAGRTSEDVLQVAWLVRALVVPTLAVRVAALAGWRAGAGAALAMVVPAWPVLVLAWVASAAPLWQVVLAEGLLVGAALVLPMVGRGLRRALPRGDAVGPVATAVGIVLAAAAWIAHDRWTFPYTF